MIDSSKKTLIINTFGIGDVLFTTPIISNLKKYNPEISIGYLCNKRAFPVVENNPKIDKTFIYERDEFNDLYKQSKGKFFKKGKELFNAIKDEKYDTVIDISLNAYMGLFCSFAGIKRRIGFDYRKRGRFLTEKIPLKGYENRHIIEYYLDLLKKIGVSTDIKSMEICIDSKDSEWTKNFLEEQQIPRNKPLIGLVPGGGASWGKEAFLKQWDAKKYAKLADYLIEKFSASIILCGNKSDEILCNEVVKNMQGKAFFACGKTSLHQFAALTKECSFLVLNDGGPLHIAVAAGAKTVSIFGPVDQNVYGPYPSKGHVVVTSDVACRPCYRSFRKANCQHILCQKDITVDQVVRKVENFYESTIY